MTVLTVVVPVFALIALGWAAARFRFLTEAGQKGLSEFSITIAIPALLFRTVSQPIELAVSPLRIWLAFFGALFATWALAMLGGALFLRRPIDDRTSIAMTSTYGNVVMLGIPLCLSIYGNAAAASIAVMLSIHTATLWGTATLQHQWLVRSSAMSVGALLFSLARDLLRNPLILAIILGVTWRLLGFTLDPISDRTLSLIAQAGIPSALIALGTSLAGFAIAGQMPTLISVIVLKLLIMPSLALCLGLLLGLPPVALGVVVLFAAMPAGANAYLFAAKVDRAIHSASGAVALGTLLSLGTVSALVALLPR